MQNPSASQQLVIRRDMSSGMVCVGWARDMPLARFEHIAVVLDSVRAGPLPPPADADGYPEYLAACKQAQQLNQGVLDRQRNKYEQQGWLAVPLDLHATPDIRADSNGSLQRCAMQALYGLTRNATEAWAAIDDRTVCAICARRPPRPMEAVEYQVWKHQTLQHLHAFAATVKAGKLVVTHSGLWFLPDTSEAG